MTSFSCGALARAGQRGLRGVGVALAGLDPLPLVGHKCAQVFAGQGLDPLPRICVVLTGYAPPVGGQPPHYQAPARYRRILVAAGYRVVKLPMGGIWPHPQFWLVYPPALPPSIPVVPAGRTRGSPPTTDPLPRLPPSQPTTPRPRNGRVGNRAVRPVPKSCRPPSPEGRRSDIQNPRGRVPAGTDPPINERSG